MKRKFFVFLALALVGFALTFNIIGCKKEAPTEEETMEEGMEEEGMGE